MRFEVDMQNEKTGGSRTAIVELTGDEAITAKAVLRRKDGDVAQMAIVLHKLFNRDEPDALAQGWRHLPGAIRQIYAN